MKEIQNSDMDVFFDRELQFHLTLSGACKNSVLTDLVNLLIQRLSGQAEKFLRTLPDTFEMTVRQFENIVEALKEGNPVSAGGKMEEHLEIVRIALSKKP